jgi:hypothetical protein
MNLRNPLSSSSLLNFNKQKIHNLNSINHRNTQELFKLKKFTNIKNKTDSFNHSKKFNFKINKIPCQVHKEI